jgi:hypothetical protein
MYQKRKTTSTPQVDVEELKKTTDKGGSTRSEAYIGGSGNTIP